MIRVDVKLMAVSVNLSLFPFNGAIYNFYEAVYFPPYMTTFDSENKHNFAHGGNNFGTIWYYLATAGAIWSITVFS